MTATSPVGADREPSSGPLRARNNPRSACEPCRNRKLKCNAERPICMRCAKAGRACEYQNDTPDWTHQFKTLEQRLKEMEARVQTANTGQQLSNGSSIAGLDHPHVATPPAAGSSASPVRSPPTASRVRWPLSAPALGPAPLSHPAGQPGPMGPLAAITVGKTNSLAASTQLLEAFTTGEEFLPILQNNGLQSSANPPRRHGAKVIVDRSKVPSPELVHALVQQFAYHHNAAYPIFHIPSLRTQVDEVCFDSSGMSSPLDICLVFHMFAVASQSLKAASPLFEYFKPLADAYWEAAQVHLPVALASPSIGRLQVLLIHLLYRMFNPGGANVWDLSGMAIRAAIDLGLHNESHTSNASEAPSTLDLDMRRRLFWSYAALWSIERESLMARAYSVDRWLCMTLGRPVAIIDEWISAGLPAVQDDDLIRAESILPGPVSPLKATVIHHLRIRIIQSEIHSRLQTPGNSCPSPEWFDSMCQKIEHWHATVPAPTGFTSVEWFEINQSISKVQLFRPTPANPNPSRDNLQKAFIAAGETMKMYRNWQRTGNINSHWLGSYQLFIAGLTYLNSLWHAHRNGWSIVPSIVDALLHVQMCSNAMEAITAVAPETKSLCLAFESVSEQIIRQLASRELAPPAPLPYVPEAGLPAAPAIPINQPQPQYAGLTMQTPSPTTLFDTTIADEQALQMNPFDDFFLQSLGSLSAYDWTKATDSAVEILQNFQT